MNDPDCEMWEACLYQVLLVQVGVNYCLHNSILHYGIDIGLHIHVALMQVVIRGLIQAVIEALDKLLLQNLQVFVETLSHVIPHRLSKEWLKFFHFKRILGCDITLLALTDGHHDDVNGEEDHLDLVSRLSEVIEWSLHAWKVLGVVIHLLFSLHSSLGLLLLHVGD